MKELWLNIRDPEGRDRRVEVDKARFVVGRHSESDLCVPNSHLSREHIRIERKGEDFILSDLGSSNGTTLNGDALAEPAVLKHGDEIFLGGSVRLLVEIPSDAAAPEPETPAEPDLPEDAGPAAGGMAASSHSSPPAGQSSSSKGLFVVIPLFGLLILAAIGTTIYFLSGRKQPVIASDSEFQYSRSSDDDDDEPVKPKETKKTEKASDETSTASPVPAPSSGAGSPGSDSVLPAPPSGENAKVEQDGASFLRRIALNDSKAFLTTEQSRRVAAKIKQFSGSSAVADNINSARKNATQIRSLATARHLQPQFLAVAAIAKLGSSRGDVAQTANGMIDALEKLRITINNEFSDDCLLMIALYDRGVSGDLGRTVAMLQQVATENNTASARSVRSIWFLEKNGKITPAEFDAALTFLAIGTITQNPKDFGVNAETLAL